MLAKIAATESSSYIEIPTNEDGYVSISELRKHFPNCVGIRYRCKSSGNLRGTRVFGDQLHLPLGISWNDYVFHCVNDDKQICMEESNASKEHSLSEKFQLETFDMIALGLPDDITDESFYRYFSKFGKLKMCELRKNMRRPKSKGYGFLRYSNFDDQNECIKTEHVIGESTVCLRLPTAKMDSSTCKRKLFVTSITPSVSLDDILEYFSVFGKITDIFKPPASAPYAFLTFDSEDAILRIFRFGDSHRVFGGYVVVEKVYTKQEMQQMHINKTENIEQDNSFQYNSNDQFDNEQYMYNNYSHFRKLSESHNEQQHNYEQQSHYDQSFAQQQDCDQSFDYHQRQQHYEQYNYERNYEQACQDSSLYHTHKSQQQNLDQGYYSNSPTQFYNTHQSESSMPLVTQSLQNYQNKQIPIGYGTPGFDQTDSYYRNSYNYSMEYQPYQDYSYSNVVFNQNSGCNSHPVSTTSYSAPSNPNSSDASLTMQIISDVATRILEQASASNEKDFLVKLLVEQLTTSKSNFEVPCVTKIDTNNSDKMIKAIQLLQNPNVLDSLIRLSESNNCDKFNSDIDRDEYSDC